MSSASAVSFSNSSIDVSAVVSLTISTFENWCRRMNPRVSFPAAPASERKHGVYAVYLSGKRSASRISSRWRLVSGTSEVGTSHRSWPSTLNASAPNLGRLAVPVIEALVTHIRGHRQACPGPFRRPPQPLLERVVAGLRKLFGEPVLLGLDGLGFVHM